MAIRNILQYPHPLLSTVSQPVISFSDGELTTLLSDMEDTLKASGAVGLAAVQVGVPVRALVVRDPTTDKIHRVVNPRIIEMSKGTVIEKEGCLSFLGLFVRVTRPYHVKVEYFNEHGELETAQAGGLLGRAIQHEIDHLDGKTFLDRLSNVERSMALSKNKIAKRRVKAIQKSLR